MGDMKKYRVPKNAITERGLKKLMKDEAKGFASLSEWASKNDITPQQVSAFMRKVQGAGLKIPEALGYKPQVIFIPVADDDISTAMPPRRATEKPSKKVDHSREPIEKRGMKSKTDRDEVKKRLKGRKK